MFQSFNHLQLCDRLTPLLLVLGNTEPDTVIQMQPQQCCAEEKENLPQPAGNAFPSVAQDTISLP